MLRYFGPAWSSRWRRGCGGRRTRAPARRGWGRRPVAEPVDEAAVAGGGGQPGGVQFVVGDALGAQVVDEGGPAGRGVAGAMRGWRRRRTGRAGRPGPTASSCSA